MSKRRQTQEIGIPEFTVEYERGFDSVTVSCADFIEMAYAVKLSINILGGKILKIKESGPYLPTPVKKGSFEAESEENEQIAKVKVNENQQNLFEK